jgi:hypothetical protein
MKHCLALTSATVMALAVAGCGSESDHEIAGADVGSGHVVPAGVARQYTVLDEEVEAKGQSVESGDWTIKLVAEAAEPWHAVHAGGHSAYRVPAPGETNHIEIIPVETATGRIVPDVPITLTVIDAAGKTVQALDLQFYYSTFFHYANNFSIPEAGTYTLRATVGAPTFNRHGAADEAPPLTEGTTVEFRDVELGAA